ncbi:MAG: Smr/MutS family protein [Bacteroidales bacterium]|nr:Smr/MutS family protein [Bacteroidales bacterium]
MFNFYPDSFEQKVGFDKVRELVVAKCLCPLGAAKVGAAEFVADFESIERMINQVDEMKSICLMENSFPIENYYDLTPSLNKIAKEGTWLDEVELQNLKRSLETIKAILTFLKKVSEKYPNIADLAKTVAYYPYVVERIDSILDRFGRIKDNASPELAKIRSAIAAKQGSVSKLVQSILRNAREQGVVEQDVTPSIREGRVVIPVSAANKRKLKGIVHDESATGKTVFIEPVEVVELNNEIRELEYDERREVIRILVDFADNIRPYQPELLSAYDFLGVIDFIRAKALFSTEYYGAKPILKNSTGTYLRQAKHPILLKSLKREGKEIVPLDIEVNQQNRILLISGPNAGGKSVCLKTFGLLQYMLQCGFLPCALENSEMGIYRGIFIDIGDEQSIENDLSTYSSHLLNMKHFLRNAQRETLVLIDEFGAGTEPMAGGAIAEAILQQLCNVGAFGVITTHYSNLKHFAANTDGIINGAMLFDNAKIEPLFKLEIGKPGSSFAFEIARKIGLPDTVLNDAASKVGEDYITFEKHLREISRDKRYWEKKRDNIRITNKKTEEFQDKLEGELAALKEQRKEIIANAKKEAQAILADANKQIENTIRTIKEANAAKEPTKQVREELDKFKKEVEAINVHDESIDRKIEQIKRRQERKQQQTNDPKVVESTNAKEDLKVIGVGDKVRIAGQSLMGEVVSLSNQSASVAFGNMITVVPLVRLEKISTNEFRKANKTIEQPSAGAGFDTFKRRLNFKSDIDIRGYRADEAIEAVQDLIDDALMLSISRVRILHGKGNGILRQVIRDYLRNAPGVKSYADEHIEFGGSGITVVDIDT